MTATRNTDRLRVLIDAGASATVNAIEYAEVRDRDETVAALRQRTLYIRTTRPVPHNSLTPAQISITGGDRIPEVPVSWLARADAGPADIPGGLPTGWAALVDGCDEPNHVLVIRTARRGDFSTYRLAVKMPGTGLPPSDWDPQLSSVELRFKVECPTDLDCATPAAHRAADHVPEPRIDYLAKDFNGFRRIMLERLAALSPAWTERSSADLGVTLVELLAYAADELSWRQDAVATEAFLGTARSRISLRRHARLVDYRIHEGCAARVWVRARTDATSTTLPSGRQFLTRLNGIEAAVVSNDDARASSAASASSLPPEVFETVVDHQLHRSLNTLRFYQWGRLGAVLERGATSATLAGHHPDLAPGTVLILAEQRSPVDAGPADHRNRYPVRLTTVTPSQDPVGGLFTGTPTSTPVNVTEITWGSADALPRALPLSHPTRGFSCAIAWGNIVLAEHGSTVVETLDPEHPVLQQGPLTYSAAAAPSSAPETPAATATVGDTDPHRAIAAITIIETQPGTQPEAQFRWSVQADLLASRPEDRHFVVETETSTGADSTTLNGGTGTATVRFGDDVNGRRPPPDSTFTVTYRVGNGSAGNIGAESIRHLVAPGSAVTHVTNPLPAAGGVDPETVDEVRRDAPVRFRTPERAVTMADYASRASALAGTQRATASMRWTGSWHTVFLTADRLDGVPVDTDFERELLQWVEPYRMAGYDLEVDEPVFVPLELEVAVCAGREHLRSDITRALAQALSAQDNPDGSRGFFHPDLWTFGQPVYLSSIYRLCQDISGIDSVDVRAFQRLGQDRTAGLQSGALRMARLEIARLDNDPNYPERGQLRIRVGGGR